MISTNTFQLFSAGERCVAVVAIVREALTKGKDKCGSQLKTFFSFIIPFTIESSSN